MSIFDVFKKIYHGVTGTPTSDEKRNQAKLVRDQMEAYRKQTEITQEEIRRKQAESEAEKRKIDEKQIRGLRSRYRPSGGLMNQAKRAGSDLATESGQPTKLGG